MQLSEIEREAVLAGRLEEMQRIQDKRNLDQMLKMQREDGEAVSKAAKRTFLIEQCVVQDTVTENAFDDRRHRHTHVQRRYKGKECQTRRAQGQTKGQR